MAFVTRSQWGARPPKRRTAIGSVAGVAAHYEGVDTGAYDHSSCTGRIRGIQNYHMDRQGWDDIAYSAAVCRHGDVFEGRGPGTRTAANGTNDANAHWYAVAIVMGPNDELTNEARRGWLDARNWLMQHGAGGAIKPHRAFFATACPGSSMTNWINAGAPLEGYTPSAPTAPPQQPPSGGGGDWTEETIMALPQLDLRNVAHQPVRSYHVANMQGLLTASGGACNPKGIDGVAGPNTLAGVKAFQQKYGLAVDGVVGPNTWRELITKP